MKQLFFFVFFCCSIFACSYDDNANVGFSNEELSPVITFTHGNKLVKISSTNGGSWTSSNAVNEQGEVIQGKSTKGFGSVIDSSGNGRYRFEMVVSRWITEDEIEYVMPNVFIDVIKPQVFKSIFTTGDRFYARYGYQISTTDEVLIEYFDENATRWSSCYQGDFSAPPYNELQPSSSFIITRSMPFGTDSIFVEAKFKARLYKNKTEYQLVNDGYFKGYFYRKP